MKKLLFCTLGTVLLLASCQKDQNAYTIKGTVAGQDLDGKYAYILNDKEEAIDSALVAKNAFKFKGSTAEVKSVIFRLDQATGRLFLEPGEIEVKVDYSDPKTLLSIKGTELNDQLSEFNAYIIEQNSKLEEEVMRIKTNKELDAEAQNQKLYETSSSIRDAISAKAKEIYTANKDNALGHAIFGQLAYGLSQEELIAEYEGASDAIKNDEKIQNAYKKAKNYVATKSGNNFVDFDATQTDGSVTKFSSFVDGKHYLLVDFWASWCGPCKRAMPFVKKVYEKFYRKGLHVLGVATWDKAEDYEKALQEHGIIWESIYDKDSNGADAYGIMGIPHLMLISPEGVILERGIDPDQLEEVVMKYIK